MSRIMTTVITSFLFTGMGLAQASSSSDRETISLLVQQVKELQEKLKALEAKQSDSEATPPQPTTFQQDVAEQAADRINRQLLRRLCTNHTAFSGAASARRITTSWTSESRTCT